MNYYEKPNWFIHLHDTRRRKNYFINIANVVSIVIDREEIFGYLLVSTVNGSYKCFIDIAQEMLFKNRLRKNNLMDLYAGPVMCDYIEFMSNQSKK